MSQPATIARHGEIAVVTLDNPPVNALSHHLREGLAKALTELRDDAGTKAIVIACAGRTFISGADITEFGTPKALASPNLPELCVMLETMPKPTVAIAYTDVRRFGLVNNIVQAMEFDADLLCHKNQLSYCSLYRRGVWDAVGG
jgi:UDP-N-acetylmuramyl tripeptide synthase